MEKQDREMTEHEFIVLEEAYFVTPFDEIVRNAGLSKVATAEALKLLLQKNYIWQMEFNKDAGDFLKKEAPDFSKVNLYHYLATKEGLLAHNT